MSDPLNRPDGKAQRIVHGTVKALKANANRQGPLARQQQDEARKRNVVLFLNGGSARSGLLDNGVPRP